MKPDLYYPVKPNIINQIFGVNPDIYAQYHIKGHNGIDFRASHGQPVYAAHSGTAFYEVDEAQGDGFVVISDKEYVINGISCHLKTIYWHLCPANQNHPKYDAKFKPVLDTTGKGTPVKAGDLLGYADNTGFSTGDHLHFGLKPIVSGQPNDSDASDVGVGNWVNFYQTNGYLGAIDPRPFFNGRYAQDIEKEIEDTIVGIANTIPSIKDPSIAKVFWQQLQSWIQKLADLLRK